MSPDDFVISGKGDTYDQVDLDLALKEISVAYKVVQNLDSQLTKSKMLLSKYKELVVKM